MINTNSSYKNITPINAKTPKIVVLGLGGGGSNAVNRMIENGMQGVTFIAANTDAQALSTNLAPVKIQLGMKATRGLGAGGLPTIGEKAAEESYQELSSALEGSEMVFLTAGMGGGTGTGSIPVAAQIARSLGAVTIAIVTKPFSFELGRRLRNAEKGIDKLRNYTNTLIVIPNDRLIEVAPRDLPLELAFTLADDVLRQGVQGIAELVTETGLINIDFAHIKHIMERGGGALMAVGTGEGQTKVEQAINSALHHPLLDEIDLTKASGMIANFTGGNDLSFVDVTDALKTLQNLSGNKSEIIPGIINDARMQDRVQLILIVTGVDDKFYFKNDFAGDQIFEQENLKDTTEIYSQGNTSTNFNIKNNKQDPNQYIAKVDFSSNLDIPVFLRKRLRQATNV
jgi:cell division protein FtsZ